MRNSNRQWRLKRRPVGEIKAGDLELIDAPKPVPGDGEMLVRNIYLSLDPTNRIWMSDMEQYMPPVAIGDVMRGGTLGIVEQSNAAGFAVGDIVMPGMGGWQDYSIGSASGPFPAQKLPKIPGVPLSTFMSALGFTGATAYFGLLDLGQPKAGETVVVSAAAGAVGQIVGQIAKIKGCRVVGLAGSDEKCRYVVKELGFDACINYKTEDVAAALKRECPNGIDVDFENVGGTILDAVLANINLKARIALCGLISQYNADGPVPGPYNFTNILMKRARVEGFIIIDYIPRFGEFAMQMAQWVMEGKVKDRVDINDGLENAVTTLGKLFTGGNTGKLLVRVSPSLELERLLSFLGLRFSDPAVELRFRSDFSRAVLPVQRAGLTLGIVVMGLFVVRDVQLTSVLGAEPLMFRLFVMIPYLTAGLGLTFTQWMRRFHQPTFFAYCIGLIVIIHILYSFATPTGPTDPRYGFRAMSSMLTIVGVVTLSGLRFEYAIVCAVTVVIGWAVTASSSGLADVLWQPTLVQLIATSLLSCGTCYWIERSHRLQHAARLALDEERAHSERLLSYTMPPRALARLKRGDTEIADAFLEAVVLFVDLAGFTDLSKRIGPRETVRVLDRIFTAFDAIVAKNGLERLKTVGDGYIAIGGTSDRGQDDLTFGARAAHEMLNAVAEAAAAFRVPLALRVGLHVGPVIGGVIGRERPIYDYWGDTLNIASRLEATAEPGFVHCSEAVYWRLRGTWSFEPRGPIELKGYTKVETYYLHYSAAVV